MKKNKSRETLEDQAASLIVSCYNSGYKDAKRDIFGFFLKAAKKIDFGNDSPNTVILGLIKILEKKIK